MVDLVAAALDGGIEAVETGGVEQHAVALWRIVVGLIFHVTSGEGIAGGRKAVGDQLAGVFEMGPQPAEVPEHGRFGNQLDSPTNRARSNGPSLAHLFRKASPSLLIGLRIEGLEPGISESIGSLVECVGRGLQEVVRPKRLSVPKSYGKWANIVQARFEGPSGFRLGRPIGRRQFRSGLARKGPRLQS